MALDPRFICSGDIESYFVDKLTGLPLSAGIINFYEDGTNMPKAVYQLTGSPGSYAFVSLGDSITLNSVGEYQDGLGNPIVIYYFPYVCTVDGDPSTSTGVQQLYTINVFNSGMQPQFTRMAWPPLAANLNPLNEIEQPKNFIPNGQFLFYNSPNQITTNDGTNNILQVAQGGWTFRKTATTGSPGTYSITFTSTINGGLGLKNFPPNAINVICSQAGSETVRDLFIAWPDVNTFSEVLTGGAVNPFTIAFQSKINVGVSSVFNVYLVQNFGGGTADVYSSPQTINVNSTTYADPYNSVTFDMPDNTGQSIGAGSYIAIAFRIPSGQTCNVSLTNFSFIVGNQPAPTFPWQTNAEMLDEGIAGWMPTPDPAGMDLYLPLILTPQGMTFDQSVVGQIIAKPQANPLPNELPMIGNPTFVANVPQNGFTYVASQFNATSGIPYQRLMNYLLLNSPQIMFSGGAASINANMIPMFGTGLNFVTLSNVVAAITTEFFVSINNPINGGSATGTGAISIAATSANIYYTATVNSVPTANYFWTFVDGLVNATFNVWYSVDNVGTAPTAPAAPGANIKVSIASTATIPEVIAATILAVHSYQFMIPNYAGLFMRSQDATGEYDIDFSIRRLQGVIFNGASAIGNYLGSQEPGAFLQHVHNPLSPAVNFLVNAPSGTSSINNTGSPVTSVATTGNAAAGGGTETRPVNFEVIFYIKY